MIAFVCASPIQIVRAFQLKTQLDEFSSKADLFLGHQVLSDSKLRERIRDTGIFENVYYIDTAKYQRASALRHMYFSKSRGELRRNKYDKLISFNIEGVVAQSLYNLNKKNKGFEFYCVEDGPTIYNIYLPKKYKWYHPYSFLDIEQPCYHMNVWWTCCPEYMEIPKEFTNTVKKLPKINIKNEALLNKVNYVFDYKDEAVLNNADLLIMEESHYTDGLLPGNDDYKLYMSIKEKYKDKRIVIKLHPRTIENRFDGKIDVLKGSKIPWELFVWNRLYNQSKPLMQISIACSTMLSDKLMFGSEAEKIMVARFFKEKISPINGYCRVNKHIIDIYERFRELYEMPENFQLPDNERKLFEILDEKFEKTDGNSGEILADGDKI